MEKLNKRLHTFLLRSVARKNRACVTAGTVLGRETVEWRKDLVQANSSHRGQTLPASIGIFL